MKTKIINIAVTEEEYNEVRKLAYEKAIKNNTRASISAYVGEVMKEYINKKSKE